MERISRGRRGSVASRGVRIGDADRELLSFAAEHRFLTAGQIARLLDVSEAAARARLKRLRTAGFLQRSRRQLSGEPVCHQITRDGLRTAGSDLPVPKDIDLAAMRHDRGLAWLMLAARDGCFGPAARVVGERRMRSEDGRRADGEARHGVRRGGMGPAGRESLHYPDTVIETPSGGRVAFELELTTKGRDARERILSAYGADRTIDAVVYLVQTAAAGRAVQRSAARLGIGSLVHVQRVRLEGTPPAGTEGRSAQLRHDRAQVAEPGWSR
ncbi:MAG: replication-relaxation family protein [Solirubrobacteraceae bacterium]